MPSDLDTLPPGLRNQGGDLIQTSALTQTRNSRENALARGFAQVPSPWTTWDRGRAPSAENQVMTSKLPSSPVPAWRPPGPSLTTRNVHSKSSGACRPSVVGGMQSREIMCESGLERKAALFLLTHPQVADLREQPQAVRWTDAAEIDRRHTFDFLATLVDGRKVAVAVKPRVKAQRRRLPETLAVIAGQVAPTFADGVLLITEADLPRDTVHNAALLHHARRGADPDADLAVGRLVTEAGQGTVGGLVAASGLEGAGFRAVMRLIASGTIRIPAAARIAYDTPVTWSGNFKNVETV